ncbi:MAG: sigma-54-dependent Fis family transcriptional regulator [Methylotenera sp.]|nr:sigma-54-dependent Fis family transcriptional regulator [Oligoflexia bacterium]
MKFLVVDDEAAIRETVAEALQALNHEIEIADSAEMAITLMRRNLPDVLLTDMRMSGMNGIELLTKTREHFPTVTTVVMTAQGTIETAISAMKKGAYDYFLKPFTFDQLEHLTQKIDKMRGLRAENIKLKTHIELLTTPPIIASRNPRMKKTIEIAEKVAVSDSTILITGESGTGKTLLAKLIHDHSPRNVGPFGVVNCATLSENLLESELFGHVRGSFTGAIKDKMGRLQAAESGTVFLDEIGEISPNLQTKLLRFLQDREFEKVGDTKTVKVDVRIIAATNKDLEREVHEGRFREDLYFRLNVIELQMPSLRQRPEDIPELVDRLLAQSFASIGKEPRPLNEQARQAVGTYGWPGNIRELKNALERAAILCGVDEVTTEDLPDRVSERSHLTLVPSPQSMPGLTMEQQMQAAPIQPSNHAIEAGFANVASGVSLDDLEKEHIKKILGTTQTLEEAAGVLGINLSTLWRKRKQYGIS